MDITLQSTGILQSGQGMDVNDAIDAIILILELHVILYRPQIVTQVLSPCRTSPGKDTTLLHLISFNYGNLPSHLLWGSHSHKMEGSSQSQLGCRHQLETGSGQSLVILRNDTALGIEAMKYSSQLLSIIGKVVRLQSTDHCLHYLRQKQHFSD